MLMLSSKKLPTCMRRKNRSKTYLMKQAFPESFVGKDVPWNVQQFALLSDPICHYQSNKSSPNKEVNLLRLRRLSSMSILWGKRKSIILYCLFLATLKFSHLLKALPRNRATTERIPFLERQMFPNTLLNVRPTRYTFCSFSFIWSGLCASHWRATLSVWLRNLLICTLT